VNAAAEANLRDALKLLTNAREHLGSVVLTGSTAWEVRRITYELSELIAEIDLPQPRQSLSKSLDPCPDEDMDEIGV
jgi:hypothetical protein